MGDIPRVRTSHGNTEMAKLKNPLREHCTQSELEDSSRCSFPTSIPQYLINKPSMFIPEDLSVWFNYGDTFEWHCVVSVLESQCSTQPQDQAQNHVYIDTCFIMDKISAHIKLFLISTQGTSKDKNTTDQKIIK